MFPDRSPVILFYLPLPDCNALRIIVPRLIRRYQASKLFSYRAFRILIIIAHNF